MLGLMSNDIIEIIIKLCDIKTYKQCRLLNHEFYSILQSSSIYYHFMRQILTKRVYKREIDYCTNAYCPNKIHNFNESSSATALTYEELNLNIELMMEYREILKSFRRQDIRVDKTMTNEFPIIRKVCKIRGTPYCEDCLSEYTPELYRHIESNSEKIAKYLEINIQADLDSDLNYDEWTIVD